MSVTRQSFVLATGDNEAVTSAQAAVVTYDPIARTVTLRGQRQPWLEPGRLYKVIVTAVGENEVGGLQAIDGATLAPGQKRRFEFFATQPTGTTYAEPRLDFCTEVLPIFAAKCASCHGGEAPTMGLDLSTPDGIARTAIGRVARETETTGRSGAPESEGRLFGMAMPRIAPGSPGSSYLLYKTEAALPPARVFERTTTCEPPAGLPRPAPSPRFAPQLPVPREADPIERAALRDLLTGRPMPYPAPSEGSYATSPLTFDERQLLRLWIAQLAPGAGLPVCGACATTP